MQKKTTAVYFNATLLALLYNYFCHLLTQTFYHFGSDHHQQHHQHHHGDDDDGYGYQEDYIIYFSLFVCA
jgi:hypothetical protein